MDIILYILLVILILLFVGLVIWIICEISMAAYHKTLRYETFFSTAEVCKKKYEEEYTTMLYIGKVYMPQIHEEEYNVYLMYDGKQYCFDDENLYNSVDVGDIVNVVIHEGYNKQNELKYVYLSLE